jgi:hypothetical protein
MNYWGPMANIKSTEWIINAAIWLLQRERPHFNFIYVPHLDYAAQKFGPNSPQAQAACREADGQLGRLFDGVAAMKLPDAAYLVASEYAMSEVSRVIYPNRMLRDAGLLRIRAATVSERRGASADMAIPDPSTEAEFLNITVSSAFAVVDHQFAHVYVAQPSDIDGVAGLFEGVEGIAEVLTGRRRGEYQLDHPRSGEVILVCEPNAWLAYYWWKDDAKAPPFARSVDIHAKPGYDPVELFFDPATKSIPLNASLVKGSHGAPAKSAEQHGAIVVGDASLIDAHTSLHDTDVYGLLCRLMA